MIYADFESIVALGDNGKKNSNESYTNKFKNQLACSYGDKLKCVDNKFNKLFKSYLGKHVVYYFINSMIKVNKDFNKTMKLFHKELVMVKL